MSCQIGNTQTFISAPVKTPKLVKLLKSVGKQIALRNVNPEKLPHENMATDSETCWPVGQKPK